MNSNLPPPIDPSNYFRAKDSNLVQDDSAVWKPIRCHPLLLAAGWVSATGLLALMIRLMLKTIPNTADGREELLAFASLSTSGLWSLTLLCLLDIQKQRRRRFHSPLPGPIIDKDPGQHLTARGGRPGRADC